MSISPPPEKMKLDVITRIAAQLAISEATIGMVAHSIHLPFASHLMSLNQGAFLCHASRNSPTRKEAALSCYEVSGVATVFKSLTPSPKTLGPMLSLMAQGLLFSTGVLLFGKNRIGQFIGFSLLSTWAFLQPFITLMITCGPSQLKSIARFYSLRLEADYHITGTTVINAVIFLFILKLAMAFFITLLVNTKESRVYKIPNIAGPVQNIRTPKKINYVFLFFICLNLIFLFIQRPSWSDFSWMALRPLGIIMVLTYFFRSPLTIKLFNQLAGKLKIFRPVQRQVSKVNIYIEEANKSLS